MYTQASMTTVGTWVVEIKQGDVTVSRGESGSIAAAREIARLGLETRATVRPSKAA